jgi:citronellol/citronellal dehydrogenase
VSYQSVFRADLFAGQRLLVTGGGSGIGRCIAHELAALGADVVLLGRSEEKLQRVQAELAEDGYETSYFSCDIRDEARVQEVIAEIQAAGKVTGLVNNAGGQFPAPLAAISKNGFEKVVQSNLVGGFLVARELFMQGMNKTGGSIVNIIADMWGGMPMMGHSGAARAGMLNLTKTAAVEWASCNIRVNAVAPGIIASSGLDTYDAGMQTVLKQAAKSIPAKRLGTESEISSAVVWLLSEGAAFASGCCIEVDGAGPLGGRMFPLADHKGWPQFDGFHRATYPAFLNED